MEILSKSVIRKSLIEKRLRLSKEDIASQSDIIVNQIRKDKNYQDSKIVGIYLPIKNEVDLQKLLEDNKTFCAPKIINNEIVFSKIDSQTKYTQGKYNILEPINLKSIREIDYLIVPAVAIFNNYRLGFGGGYYDKFLSKLRPKHVVGVIYSFQEVKFEVDEFDQPLDYYFKG